MAAPDIFPRTRHSPDIQFLPIKQIIFPRGDTLMLRNCGSSGWVRLGIAALLFAAGTALYAGGVPAEDRSMPDKPTDPKALKTFKDAVEFQKRGMKLVAIDEFRKANKQDNGHCPACLNRALDMALEMDDFKDAESIVKDELPQAESDAARAGVHVKLAMVLQREGNNTKKDKYFADSCDEFKTALQLDPGYTTAHYGLGVSLAHLHQDDAARAEFKTFLDQDKAALELHPRAERFVERVELARARMAPAFSVTTLDGRRITMDELTGKVVLIDFWATWCGPCREALPHIRKIAQEFNGQPLVVLSVSLDTDDAKWKSFVAQNEMTWPQYRDGAWNGQMARMFAVNEIPTTFSIDADGVLEDQHVGEASIEGKLKKMVAQAVELSNHRTQTATAVKVSGTGD
jgi:thiol-disulfide isomerase/thioredoxin